MRILRLDEVDSTNTYVEQHTADLRHGDVVVTDRQTAGRGQRGNSWESEPGENITFTMLLKPRIEATQQFMLSCAVALAVCDTLKEMCSIDCLVKWPNDIYAGDDRKICGILISHSLQGKHINHTIAGVGININQQRFLSDAPNPASVWQLTGRRHDCETILHSLADKIDKFTDRLSDPSFRTYIKEEYMRRLWRGDGATYPFLETSTGERFDASVVDIEPLGHLLLRYTDGKLRRYAFKEVAWL